MHAPTTHHTANNAALRHNVCHLLAELAALPPQLVWTVGALERVLLAVHVTHCRAAVSTCLMDFWQPSRLAVTSTA